MPRMSWVKSISAKPAVVLRVSLRSGGVYMRGVSVPNLLVTFVELGVARVAEREVVLRVDAVWTSF